MILKIEKVPGSRTYDVSVQLGAFVATVSVDEETLLHDSDMILDATYATGKRAPQRRFMPSSLPLTKAVQVGGEDLDEFCARAGVTKASYVALAKRRSARPSDREKIISALGLSRSQEMELLGPPTVYKSRIPELDQAGVGAAIAAAGLTPKEFAEKASVSYSTVLKARKGHPLTLNPARAIARALGTTPEALGLKIQD